jgi:hypothetical protein
VAEGDWVLVGGAGDRWRVAVERRGWTATVAAGWAAATCPFPRLPVVCGLVIRTDIMAVPTAGGSAVEGADAAGRDGTGGIWKDGGGDDFGEASANATMPLGRAGPGSGGWTGMPM